MTVKELIAELSKMDGDFIVVTDHDEAPDIEEIDSVETVILEKVEWVQSPAEVADPTPAYDFVYDNTVENQIVRLENMSGDDRHKRNRKELFGKGLARVISIVDCVYIR